MPNCRGVALLMAGVLAGVLPAGCGSSLPTTTRDAAYSGPGLVLDSTGPTHAIVIQAPTPGHTVSLDAVRDRLGGREALVTIRQPDPRFMVAQVVVTQRIGTDVPVSVPLDVFVRQMEFDNRENRVYVFVETSQGAGAAGSP